MPRSLRRNFCWTIAGNAVYAACQWGIATGIVKIGSVEKLGQFALGLAIAGPVFLLTDLSLRAVQSTDAKRDFAFGTYLGLRLVTVGIGLLAVLILVASSAQTLEAAAVAMVVGFTKACESLGDVCYGFLQQHERMDIIAKSLLGKGLMGGLALVGVLKFTQNLLWAVAAMGLVWLAVVGTYDIRRIASISRKKKGGVCVQPGTSCN